MAMATSATCIVVVLLMLMAPALGHKSPAGPLWHDFYSSSCPKAEEVIRNIVKEIISNDPTMGAAFLKLFFVDCFIRGCDASILLDSVNNSFTEKESVGMGTRAIDHVNTVKAAVEAICPGVVSCADIIAIAARDSVTISGGFSMAMPTGRRDGLVSNGYDIMDQLPYQEYSVRQLIDMFAAKNLDVDDLVTLSGAHSFGTAACNSFCWEQLYPDSDELTINPTFAASLKQQCPDCMSYNSHTRVNMNQVTDPNTLSNQYYSNVESKWVLFTSDQTLLMHNDTAAKVAYYARNPIPWMAHFAKALVKMGTINVLTRTAGEIRKFCNATNSG